VKWVSRNKGLSAGLTVAALALLLGTAVAMWQAVVARIAAHNEATQRQATENALKTAELEKKKPPLPHATQPKKRGSDSRGNPIYADLGPATSFSYATTGGTTLPDAPVDPGSYRVVAHYAGSSNYARADNASFAFTIDKATPAISVIDAGGPSTGSPYPATANIAWRCSRCRRHSVIHVGWYRPEPDLPLSRRSSIRAGSRSKPASTATFCLSKGGPDPPPRSMGTGNAFWNRPRAERKGAKTRRATPKNVCRGRFCYAAMCYVQNDKCLSRAAHSSCRGTQEPASMTLIRMVLVSAPLLRRCHRPCVQAR
jgi:hypothetical protein